MFRSTITSGLLTLFDSNFAINNANWPEVDAMLTSHFELQTKQEEISDEPASLCISVFRKEDNTEKI